jgi:hypothetical protein
MLARLCQRYDYVISNLRVLGLLKMGAPDKWRKPEGPMQALTREEYIDFVRTMRTHGVDVRQTRVTLRFSFLVDDLLDTVPRSWRLEIEKLHMASPGGWGLTLAGGLAKKEFLEPVRKIIEAILFYPQIKAKKKAETRLLLATADKTKAEADHVRAQTEGVRAGTALKRAQSEVILSASQAMDTLVASWRHAGFLERDNKARLQDPVEKDLAMLTNLKCNGLIKGIYLDLENVQPEDDQPDAHT